MEAASIRDLKKELKEYSQPELAELCLKLAKFKKETKEFLTYLVYEADDEESYILSIKERMDEQFDQINAYSYYIIKKSIRKILREAKKFIRFSKQKKTEAEVLLHFCRRLSEMKPSIKRNTVLSNILERQLTMAEKAIGTLHEDLQYDYQSELEEIR